MKRVWLFILVLIGLIAPMEAMAAENLVIPAGYVGNYTEVLGIPIRYHQVGSGPDLLLIHGQPGSIEDWQPLYDALASRYRLTIYDRPGNGFSGSPRKYTLAQNADVALALIEQLHLDHPVVIGHSYGGGVVMELATRKPSAIKAFVSVAGCSYPLGSSDWIFHLLRIPYVGRALITLTPRSTKYGMVRDGVREAFHPNEQSIPADYIDAHFKIWSQPKNMLTMAREDGPMNASLKKIIPLYKDIEHPIYLVHGTQDQLVPVEDSKKLSTVAPPAHLTLLENTGHMVQYVRTDDLIKVIDAAVQGEESK